MLSLPIGFVIELRLGLYFRAFGPSLIFFPTNGIRANGHTWASVRFDDMFILHCFPFSDPFGTLLIDLNSFFLKCFAGFGTLGCLFEFKGEFIGSQMMRDC